MGEKVEPRRNWLIDSAGRVDQDNDRRLTAEDRTAQPWHAARHGKQVRVDLSAFDQAGARVLDNPLVTEVEDSYLEYAFSVIHSRALPDARDGLKPVHRRILCSMYEQGYRPDRAHVKSARVVGDVMGKYHPHGDAAIYDAMVRLAQDFSMNAPLIDGHGNFGSPDDGPAAARYTEARMSPEAMLLVGELGEETVDFHPNYDGSLSSRRCCRRPSPTCWSTAPPASPSAWRPT